MNINLIAKIKFGSHLYGTESETSDTDYKGVYLPAIEDCFLNRVKKSLDLGEKLSDGIKNNSSDTDYTLYSLQYFVDHLGRNGDTTFLDMIHAPDSAIVDFGANPTLWRRLRESRSKFYTKSLKSYLNYLRGQTARYGIKGSKLAEAEKILTLFNSKDDSVKLATFWEELPSSDYSKSYNLDTCQAEDKRVFDFSGKKLMATTSVFYAKQTVQSFYDSYGAGAQLAKANKGIDWKAYSHAARAGLQLKELYETGDLIFPLKDANYLRDVKLGNYHYLNDSMGEKLEALADEVEALANSSNLPEKVDERFISDLLLSFYK